MTDQTRELSRPRSWHFGPPGEEKLFEFRDEIWLLAGAGTRKTALTASQRWLLRELLERARASSSDPRVLIPASVTDERAESDKRGWLKRHASALRRRLQAHAPTSSPIENVRGAGYILGEAWTAVHADAAATSEPPLLPEARQSDSVVPDEPLRWSGRLNRLSNIFSGRRGELDYLTASWHAPDVAVVVVHALGGGGKTTLIDEWLTRSVRHAATPGVVLVHSFRDQGQEGQATSEGFFRQAARTFGRKTPWSTNDEERGRQLARFARAQSSVIILDGVEPLQQHSSLAASSFGRIQDAALWAFLHQWCLYAPTRGHSLCVITSRYPLPRFEVGQLGPSIRQRSLEALDLGDGVDLLVGLGVVDYEGLAARLVRNYHGHCLSLTLVAQLLVRSYEQDVRRVDLVGPLLSHAWSDAGQAMTAILDAYHKLFIGGPEETILEILALFDRPLTTDLTGLLRTLSGPLSDRLRELTHGGWKSAVSSLCGLSMVSLSGPRQPTTIDTHPIIREYFREHVTRSDRGAWIVAHRQLYEHFLLASPTPTPFNRGEGHYRAAWHGVNAGCHVEVFNTIYRSVLAPDPDHPRSITDLGTVAEDLSLFISLFTEPWRTLAPGFDVPDQDYIYQQTAYALRRMGRLDDATECGQAALGRLRAAGQFKSAARVAENLHETELVRGRLHFALSLAVDARKCAQDFVDSAAETDRREAAALVEQQARKTAVVLAFLGAYPAAAHEWRSMRATRAALWRDGDAKWRALLIYHWAYLLECRGSLRRGLGCARLALGRLDGEPTEVTAMLSGVVGRMWLERSLAEGRGVRHAKSQLQASLDLLRRFEKPIGLSRSLTALAELLVDEGRYDKASIRLGEADGQCHAAAITLFDAERLYVRAKLEFAQGKMADGDRHMARAGTSPGAPMFVATARRAAQRRLSS